MISHVDDDLTTRLNHCMRQYLCECTACGGRKSFQFDEPYPEYGDTFIRHCDLCVADTLFTRVLTRKARAEMNSLKEEQQLQEKIRQKCAEYGFSCRFYLESVIITTPIASWQFAYHEKLKTLRHESTVKVNFDTGDPAAMHYQFRNRKMSVDEVIDYIAAHDIKGR